MCIVSVPCSRKNQLAIKIRNRKRAKYIQDKASDRTNSATIGCRWFDLQSGPVAVSGSNILLIYALFYTLDTEGHLVYAFPAAFFVVGLRVLFWLVQFSFCLIG